jgi:dienelactone hydrolase
MPAVWHTAGRSGLSTPLRVVEVFLKNQRMPDAYAAQAYLARQPFIDTQRIGLMGWSHGGWTLSA